MYMVQPRTNDSIDEGVCDDADGEGDGESEG